MAIQQLGVLLRLHRVESDPTYIFLVVAGYMELPVLSWSMELLVLAGSMELPVLAGSMELLVEAFFVDSKFLAFLASINTSIGVIVEIQGVQDWACRGAGALAWVEGAWVEAEAGA